MHPWQADYWTPERLLIHRRALVAGLILGFVLGCESGMVGAWFVMQFI